MRKVVSAIVVAAVAGGSYVLGFGASGHSTGGHTVQADSSAKSVAEGNSNHNLQMLISVSPVLQVGEEVSVDVNCLDGTATQAASGAGNPDYSCTAQTVTFDGPADVQEPLTTPINIKGDTAGETNETFTIALFNARCTDTPPGGTCTVSNSDPADVQVTINNDDALPGTISINDASGAEGNRNETKDITFTVTLSSSCTVAQGNLQVPFDTQSGTATEGVDFTDKSGTLTFAPGDTSEQIVVKTIGDNSGEANETFTVALGPLGGSCAPNVSGTEPPGGTSDLHATGTIDNDDGPAGAPVNTSCSGNASGDFNGDGRKDLAVGIPGQSVNGQGNAGAVQVIYGSLAAGLVDAGKQVFTQGADGMDDQAENGDQLGACVAAGFFNDDGFSDLAIAAPGEDFTSGRGSSVDAGGVAVIYGGAAGLNAAGATVDQFWTQDSSGVLGANETGDGAGNALTAHDFNGDGRDDLAIGVQLEDIGSTRNAGAVNVLPGSATGLTSTGDKLIFQDAKRYAGSSERDDHLGAALAGGDLNGDAIDDLVIGAPDEALGTTARAGAVQVVLGAANGLSGLRDRIWFQGNSGVLDVPEAADRFAASVAVGDFNGDSIDDLAIGVPFEDLGTRTDVGAVAVLYSTSTGPSSTNNELWSEADSAKTTGDTPNTGDVFGFSLTAGDFNGSGGHDLAIGTPGNDFAGTNAGSISVVYASTTGLGTPQHFTQSNLASSVGGGEAEDALGTALANGDYNGDGRADLAAGVSREDLGSEPDAGAVNVVYGSPTGLLTTADQFWTQDTGTVQVGGSQNGDQYGGGVG